MTTAEVKSRIADIIFGQSPGVALSLAVCGWIMGIGFFVGATNNNYVTLTSLMPFISWGSVFIIYATIKSYGVLIAYKTQTWLDIANSAIGVWAWNYIFLSFVLFDQVPAAPTEFLLLVPVLGEVWSLTSIIYQKNRGEGG